MRIGIPIAEGRLCTHFGHAESFALIDVDVDKKTILNSQQVCAPPHEPGLLPRWLADQGVKVVLAGGMGQRAKALFSQYGITVIVGVPAQNMEDLVTSYLAGTLKAGENICDH